MASQRTKKTKSVNSDSNTVIKKIIKRRNPSKLSTDLDSFNCNCR